MFFFFFKQKTAYEMRISDWSSDVCSSDLQTGGLGRAMQILERDLTGEPGERGVIVAHAERGFSHDGAGWQRIVELLCDIIGGALVAALIGKPGGGEQRFEPFLGIERRFCQRARAGEQRARLSVAARERKSTRRNSRHSCAPPTP